MTIARQRDGVPTINQSPAETALAFDKLIEMDTGRVLIEPGGDLVLGFLDGDAVDVVDLFSDLVVGKTM